MLEFVVTGKLSEEFWQDIGSKSPLHDYLDYILSKSEVEALGHGVVGLTLPFWSLPATRQMAEVGMEGFSPWCRLYISNGPGGSREVSDRGENVAALAGITVDDDVLVDDVRQYVMWDFGGSVAVASDGSIRAVSPDGMGFGEAIHRLVLAIEMLNNRFGGEIHGLFESSRLPDVFSLTGKREESSELWNVSRGGKAWCSERFSLDEGALVVWFEKSDVAGRRVQLVREEAGWWDDPMTMFDLDANAGTLGLWLVTEGRVDLHDPAPGIPYHIEVSCTEAEAEALELVLGSPDAGKHMNAFMQYLGPVGIERPRFKYVLLQPDLDQATVSMPFRAHGSGGAEVAGPFRMGTRPLLARVRHDGGGEFLAKMVNLDGYHEVQIASGDGQIRLDGRPVEARPEKAYLLYVVSEGDWEVELTEED